MVQSVKDRRQSGDRGAAPAIEKLRAAFPKAHITLVVGSWNRVIAEGLGLFDEVIAFDAFPRNSSEERPDVLARVPAFDALIIDSYDLAIDLRTDHDTRILLRNVRARSKAGIGFKIQFDFLDIFLPIDSTRADVEAASDTIVPLANFGSHEACHRTRFQIACKVKGEVRGVSVFRRPLVKEGRQRSVAFRRIPRSSH